MITGFDHVVLTVSDIDVAAKFYQAALGMRIVIFAQDRVALHFGSQKINLQTLGQETRNHAAIGSADICLVTDWNPQKILQHFANLEIPIVEGPVKKTGAGGEILSIYINDPDGNLVEISSY